MKKYIIGILAIAVLGALFSTSILFGLGLVFLLFILEAVQDKK